MPQNWGGELIPIRDTVRSRRKPIITIIIIAINIVVFLYQNSLGTRAYQMFVAKYSIIPVLGFYQPWRFITSAFLHGSWLHLIGNMLYLWIFGDNVEDKTGHFKFVLFYILAAAIAGFAQMLTDVNSLVPVIGASGAVAGILGAYFICCPGSRVVTLIPIFFFFTTVEIPAFVYLLGWFALQFINGVSTVGGASSVAWWAHIGGFVAGMVLIKLFYSKQKRRDDFY